MDAQDLDLVARVVSSKDAAAFGELIRRHQSQVRNFLCKLAGDTTLADDLAQDAFIHAWDKIGTFSGKGTFIGWLLKVAYTTFLQSKRRSKRYAEILRDVREDADAVGTGYTKPNEEVTDLDKLLAVLEPNERAIMVMAYACGLSHREISDATDMPVGTIKSLIHRSKEKIRSDFELERYSHG
jgi:RNA polymerase sigma factor (sigma-70 family)